MVTGQSRHDFQAILFDLDGTLIRAQMSEFIPRYVQALANFSAELVKPRKFEKALLKAIHSLISQAGDGVLTNEQRVYAAMLQEAGVDQQAFAAGLNHFREHHLEGLSELIRPIPLARQIVHECRQRQIPLVLATNPVFPRFIIEARMAWADLDRSDFSLVTAYENSHYCKPQADYFRNVAESLQIEPEKCLMVGNDLQHDLAAVAVGMKAYLVDTWMVERPGPSWPCEERGDHAALQRYLDRHLAK